MTYFLGAPAFAAPPEEFPDLGSPAAGITATRRAMLLGPGDAVAIQVFGQPDMSATTIVADDGSVAVPFAGPVPIGGLSLTAAARRIEKALVDGHILVSPQVTVTLAATQTQRVSVLGEVGAPGRYPIESSITILDLLAQAGGIRDTGSMTVILMRPDAAGNISRHEIDVHGLMNDQSPLPAETLQGGDTIYVPKAPQFYIAGEVNAPNQYRVEPGMTYLQAIARAGGITIRGSSSRFEVRRKDANGVEKVIKAKLSDLVQPGDIIRVKESIF